MLEKLRIFSKHFRPSIRPVYNVLNNAFGKYLLLTNVLSSGGAMFLGDLLQQELEYQQNKLEKRYNMKRLGHMSLIGLTVGPMHHYFYLALNNRFPQRSFLSITKKVLIDQIFMGPVSIAFFFYFAGFLERKTVNECKEELKSKFMEVYMVDWCLWPPAQYLNFYYIPVKYQVVYINILTFLYNAFLSYIKHREEAYAYKTKYEETLQKSKGGK